MKYTIIDRMPQSGHREDGGDLEGNMSVAPLAPVERVDPTTGQPIQRMVPP